MSYEIDFLPVGEGEKSGDAIAIRCGNLTGARGEQFVMVKETLIDPRDDATSAENNSSVILLLRLDGQDLLFTADAGVPALLRTAQLADLCGISLPSCRFQQVPHHGSKRNVGPTLLNRLVGPKLSTANAGANKLVFVSAAAEGRRAKPAP
jgi:beta-lactamase superfamily II metal-dependent hydrolase